MDTAARTTDGPAIFWPLALTNGECEADFALQQFFPCEQGIVLQHCIICNGVIAAGHSTAYTERADTSPSSRIAFGSRIPHDLIAAMRTSQALSPRGDPLIHLDQSTSRQPGIRRLLSGRPFFNRCLTAGNPSRLPSSSTGEVAVVIGFPVFAQDGQELPFAARPPKKRSSGDRTLNMLWHRRECTTKELHFCELAAKVRGQISHFLR